jgi:autotransporter-associated beta strand protein
MSSGSTLQNLSGTSTWSGNVALGAGNGVTVTGGSGANTTISGVISGTSGTLIKSGANTLTLSNANTFTGLTKVTQGTLALGSSGSIADSSEIQISNGATLNVTTVSGGYVLENTQTLSGGGTVSGNTTIEGIHSPGFSPGIQTFTSNLTYADGATIVWELTDNTAASASRGTLYDGINVQGNLTFGGATTLDLTFDLASSSVDWTNALWSGYLDGVNGWKVFDVDGSVIGLGNLILPSANTLYDSNGVALSAVRSNAFFYYSQETDGIYLNYAVPEPTVTALGGLGLLLLARRRRGIDPKA